MPAFLSIKNLSISFPGNVEPNDAVKNISFDVNPGEIVAIVGESGSGKSVTALSILQLLPAQALCSGQVLFSRKDNDRINLLKCPSEKLPSIRGKDIAMIFQEPMSSLNPVLTCGSQVTEAIRLHLGLSKTIARQKTLAIFEQVRLPNPAGILQRYPHQLSGGQKQRVMIAMAISCNPSLLIADEPTTALDVTVQKNILDLIKELKEQQGMGVIFITHDLGVVAEMADTILVMFRGEIVEQGKTCEILLNPQHPYTKALLACRPAGQPKGKRLPVISDFMESTEQKVTGYRIPDQDQQTPDITESENPLTVKNLCISYPDKKDFLGRITKSFKAVDDVSFIIKKGEIVGLVGESGCGKTTLGRAILQLKKPSSGEIMINGKEISREKTAAMRQLRKDLQIVFQDPYGSLNPRIAIGHAILEPLKVHSLFSNNKERREKVMEMLEKVNLSPDHYHRYPHQFSGGQRQRICIARALAMNPSFLIFDESVSALDVSVQAQVLNLINDLKKEFGFTALFISHDLSVVHYLCNRIMVMQKGKIVEQGPADEVYLNPQNEYTQSLIRSIPGKNITQILP